MQQGKRIFITGTNRGLGKSLVALLHKQHPQAQIHISSRNSPQVLAQQWSKEFPDHIFSTYQINLDDSQSITKSVQLMKERNVVLDCIVANAAIGIDRNKQMTLEESSSRILKTNVVSTIDLIKQFIPLLSEAGRVVIVSSNFGGLKYHQQEFISRVDNPSITEQEILSIVDQYMKCVKANDMGYFFHEAYHTSKALINAWGRFVLPKYLKECQTFVCLHPGWCVTDMGGPNADLTAEQGAEIINTGIWIKETEPTKFLFNDWCDYYNCE